MINDSKEGREHDRINGTSFKDKVQKWWYVQSGKGRLKTA